MAGVGTWRRTGPTDRPRVLACSSNSGRTGLQHSATRAARSWFPPHGVADISQHGSAEQCRGHDAGGIGGPRVGSMVAAPVQCDRDIRGVHGKPGRRAGGASRKGRWHSGLHTDIRPQRDDRPTPRQMGTVGSRHHRPSAVRCGYVRGIRGRSPGRRTDSAPTAPSHRGRLARPDGDARTRPTIARTVGWRVVLAPGQPCRASVRWRRPAASERFLRGVSEQAREP